MRRQLIPSWVIQLSWFVAGIFATGAVWFFLSKDDTLATTLSICAAIVLTVISVTLQRAGDKEKRFKHLRDRIGGFLEQGSKLQRQSDSGELTDDKLRAWQESVEDFFAEELDKSYVARFYDFTGITFYSDGSDKTHLRNSLKGNIFRLHEFLREFQE